MKKLQMLGHKRKVLPRIDKEMKTNQATGLQQFLEGERLNFFGDMIMVFDERQYYNDKLASHDKRLIEKIVEMIEEHKKTSTYDNDDDIALFYTTLDEIKSELLKVIE